MRTRVGYAGGTTPHPTYEEIGDHSEAIQLDYDPAVISYAELLRVVWDGHAPCGARGSRQYQAFVFVHDDAQRREAEASRARVAERLGRPLEAITTPIQDYTGFTRAEDYHQKFYLQGSELSEEVEGRYEEFDAFVDSTLAARLNGYLRHGDAEQLAEELPRMDLSAEAEELLRKWVGGGR